MIQTPQNIRVLTNVTIVKLKKGGKQFELACYKNQMANWRAGQTTDIDEVIHIKKIFTNVTQGQEAANDDLKVFGNKLKKEEIFMEILNKGLYQVSEAEREKQLEDMKKEIAHLIVEMVVNAKDLRPIPLSQILKAMEDCKIKINVDKSTKKQALDIIKELEKGQVLPIKRARMRLLIHLMKDEQIEEIQEIFKENFKDEYEIEKIVREQSKFQLQVASESNLYRRLYDVIQTAKMEDDGRIQIGNKQEEAKESEGQPQMSKKQQREAAKKAKHQKMDEEEQVTKNDDAGWEEDDKKGKKGKKGGKGKGKNKGGKDSDDDFKSKTQESTNTGKQQEEASKEQEIEVKKEEKASKNSTSTLHFEGCSIEILQQAIKLEVDEDGNPIAKAGSSVQNNDFINPSPKMQSTEDSKVPETKQEKKKKEKNKSKNKKGQRADSDEFN